MVTGVTNSTNVFMSKRYLNSSLVSNQNCGRFPSEDSISQHWSSNLPFFPPCSEIVSKFGFQPRFVIYVVLYTDFSEMFHFSI